MMDMNSEDLGILDDLCDDYTGLWEIRWRYNTWLDAPDYERVLKRSMALILAFFDKGMVEVFLRKQGTDVYEPLDGGMARKVLSDERCWKDPDQISGKLVYVAGNRKLYDFLGIEV